MIFDTEWFSSQNDTQKAQIITLLLVVGSQGEEIFLQTQVIKTLLEKLKLELKDIQTLPPYLLEHLQKPLIPLVIDNLLILQKSQIIDTQLAKKLISKLDLLSLQEIQTVAKALAETFFTQSLGILENCLERLKPIIHNIEILEDLQKSLKNAREQKFSIGVTGVLSAGKSTFLNALLGSEILGSSTIPETANLTTMQHSSTPYAKVVFWSKKEWEELLKSTHFSDSNSFFSTESLKHYHKEIEHVIQEVSLQKQIQLDELQSYTSANHPSKLCYFVKQVDLFLPLEILKDTQIVDTPGLDDPIIEREIITRDYLAHCDLMIHAINASQPATQKDVSFILETLLSQNIARVLILLTRSDLLSASELEASLQYTQSTLLEQLRVTLQDKERYLQLITRLSFLPIASYDALLCRTNRVKSAKLTLQTSGFEAVMAYLSKVLLGEDSLKCRDIIYLSAKFFLKNTQILTQELQLQLEFLESGEEEFLELLSKQEFLLAKNKQALSDTQAQKELLKENLESFLATLENMLNHKLLEMQNILLDRITNEADYCYTHHTTIKEERLHSIVYLGLQDFLVDITREYGQKLTNKINELTQILSLFPQKFEDLSLEHTWGSPPVLQYFCGQDSIVESAKRIGAFLPKLTSKYTTKTRNTFELELKELFESMLEGFSHLLKQKAGFFKTTLEDFFYKEIEDFLENIIKLLQAKEHSIALAKEQRGGNEASRQQKRIDIRAQKSEVQTQQKILQQLMEQCV